MKKYCTYCQIEISEEEIKKGEAHNLWGEWSHVVCDENELAKIDRNTRVIKPKNEV